jgi:uncharacterized small protein (DUF1192 family)
MMHEISAAQLRKAAEIKDKIESLQSELNRLLNGTSSKSASPSAPATSRKRTISPEGRARIIAAQKKRWAKQKAAKK